MSIHRPNNNASYLLIGIDICVLLCVAHFKFGQFYSSRIGYCCRCCCLSRCVCVYYLAHLFGFSPSQSILICYRCHLARWWCCFRWNHQVVILSVYILFSFVVAFLAFAAAVVIFFGISYSRFEPNQMSKIFWTKSVYILWINRLTTITIIIVIMAFRWNFINTNSIHYMLIALLPLSALIMIDSEMHLYISIIACFVPCESACACHSPKIGS